MTHFSSRRQLIKAGVFAAISAPLAQNSLANTFTNEQLYSNVDAAPWAGFKVGIASYTFRKMSLDDTIKSLQKLGLKYISIKDFHLALTSSSEERRTAMQKLKDAGIIPLSCGNITLENNEANIRRAFDYAKDCNIPTIVCSPHPDSISILDKMVKEYDIKLAIHNHGPEDKRFPSPYDAWKWAQAYDKRIGLCIDIGHTLRAKVNPAEAIVKCRERLYDLHFKDIDSSEAKGNTIQAGRGVIDLAAVILSLLKIRFDYLLSIEYESSPDDPLPAVAETVGFIRGAVAAAQKKK